MKILQNSLIVMFLVFAPCLCVNSPEFKKAVELLQEPEINANFLVFQIDSLIKKNKNIVTEKEDETGNTLFHYSKNKGWPSVNDTLEKHGVDVNARNALGETPEEFASEERLKREKVLRHQKERLWKNNTIDFQKAISLFNNDEIKRNQLLSELNKLVGNNPNIITEKEHETDNTLLHYSKQKGLPSINAYLIRKGADINAKNAEGQTPDEFAGESGLKKETYLKSKHKSAQEEKKREEEAQEKKKQEKKEKRKREKEEKEQQKKKKKNEETQEPFFDDFDRLSFFPDPQDVQGAYSMLGLNSNASWDEIKKEWQRLIRLVHPDVNQHRSTQAHDNAQKINAAYNILKEHYGH